MPTLLETFRDEIEAFLAKSGMSPTALGKTALGDPTFVIEMRAGRVPGLDVVQRVHEFMEAHKVPERQS